MDTFKSNHKKHHCCPETIALRLVSCSSTHLQNFWGCLQMRATNVYVSHSYSDIASNINHREGTRDYPTHCKLLYITNDLHCKFTLIWGYLGYWIRVGPPYGFCRTVALRPSPQYLRHTFLICHVFKQSSLYLSASTLQLQRLSRFVLLLCHPCKHLHVFNSNFPANIKE